MAKREPSCELPDCQTLVREWYGRVYALCRSRLRLASDAEDAAQETFLRAIRGWDELRRPQSLGGWLRSIANNTCVDCIRRKHVDVYEVCDVESVSADSDHPSDGVAEDELLELIHALPEALREPLLLHYYDHMTYDQIAQWMGIARSTVNERLSKARNQLRRQLTMQECHDEL